MKILLILTLIFAGFVGAANAQLCGTYGATLIIKDEASKAIENVEIKIVPLQADDYTLGRKFVRDDEDASRFRVQFREKYFVKGKYKIIISANGFLREEKEIIFLYCERQTFEITLKANQVSTQGNLRGTVTDENGGVITGLKVQLTGKNGKTFNSITDENGSYSLECPAGIYSNEFVGSSGFLTTKVEN